MYGGVDGQIHVFFTSALVGGEWSASRPYHFTPEERGPDTHWVGGWVGARTRSRFLNAPLTKANPVAVVMCTTVQVSKTAVVD
jgi:hypothetical protein